MTASRCSILYLLALLLAGCSREHYHSQASKDTYGILGRKQQLLFGQTNAFTIDTPYSQRDVKDMRWEELLANARTAAAGRSSRSTTR